MSQIIRRILVVEDDPGDARLMRENLRDAFGEGALVEHRATLGEALTALRSGPVSVVLLDLRLPDGEGPESVRKIRQISPDVPVIVATHLDDLPTALECIDAGAQEYVTKAELGPRTLHRVIAHAVERHHLARAAERAREAERQAERTTRELAAVVEHAGEAIVTWSLDGKVVSWNRGAERICGVGSAETLGRPMEELVPEEFREEWRRRVRDLLDGKPVAMARTARRRPDGREVEIEESLFLIPDEMGRTARVGCVARDVTELIRLKRAMEAATPGAQTESRSAVMRDALQAADLAAGDANATVLLLGETGSGKGWLARRIHQSSPRAGRPFFEINCAGLAPALLESEMFGHERGAFTGAVRQKRGLVEDAEGGTVFLDEIAELSPELQAHLLTFVDTRTFRRVGGNRPLSADVRILAATNADLRTGVERGAFRRDLYYRISVVPIRVPPLRERREDVAGMARTLLAELATRSGRREIAFDGGVEAALQRYDWPGNVRELRNALERAIILSRGETIRIEHLPAEFRGLPDPVAPDSLQEVEREQILRVLRQVDGNRTRAAEILGISRATLKRRLAEMHRTTRRSGSN